MNIRVRLVDPRREARRSRILAATRRLFDAATGARRRRREAFQQMMSFAAEIAHADVLALSGLINLVGRRVQAWALSEVLRWPEGKARIRIHYESRDLLFSPFEVITPDKRRFVDVILPLDPTKFELRLGLDLILPWPWSGSRMGRALCGLRPGGSWGVWKQDPLNHLIERWAPLGIGWVHGGNHSIAAGIAYGSGTIIPSQAFDISPAYEHVECDGLVYRRTYDKRSISDVPNLDMAVLFEIGRLMSRR